MHDTPALTLFKCLRRNLHKKLKICKALAHAANFVPRVDDVSTYALQNKTHARKLWRHNMQRKERTASVPERKKLCFLSVTIGLCQAGNLT